MEESLTGSTLTIDPRASNIRRRKKHGTSFHRPSPFLFRLLTDSTLSLSRSRIGSNAHPIKFSGSLFPSLHSNLYRFLSQALKDIQSSSSSFRLLSFLKSSQPPVLLSFPSRFFSACLLLTILEHFILIPSFHSHPTTLVLRTQHPPFPFSLQKKITKKKTLSVLTSLCCSEYHPPSSFFCCSPPRPPSNLPFLCFSSSLSPSFFTATLLISPSLESSPSRVQIAEVLVRTTRRRTFGPSNRARPVSPQPPSASCYETNALLSHQTVDRGVHALELPDQDSLASFAHRLQSSTFDQQLPPPPAPSSRRPTDVLLLSLLLSSTRRAPARDRYRRHDRCGEVETRYRNRQAPPFSLLLSIRARRLSSPMDCGRGDQRRLDADL